MTPRSTVALACIVFSALTGCRTIPPSNKTVLAADSSGPRVFCESGSKVPVTNENVLRASAAAEKIFACAQRLLAPPPLTPEEDVAATRLFEGFVRSGCNGCHSSRSSFGGLAQFVSNESAGREEFLRGIALRHHYSRTIIETCVEDSPARQALMKVFTKRRHKSEAGLRYSLNGRNFTTAAGIPFFTKGSDEEMRSQVMSFLQGGFEIAAAPGDELHDTLLEFIAAGGRLNLETHACIIRDALISVSNQGPITVK